MRSTLKGAGLLGRLYKALRKKASMGHHPFVTTSPLRQYVHVSVLHTGTLLNGSVGYRVTAHVALYTALVRCGRGTGQYGMDYRAATACRPVPPGPGQRHYAEPCFLKVGTRLAQGTNVAAAARNS